ncbi:MFS transporter [Methylocella sp.]|uniref:MFS transporter n=1 Tax=Methylocella sp. TaxID=1978226 RepID=UPI0037841473
MRSVDRGRYAMLGLVGVVLVLSMATWFSGTAVLGELQRAHGLDEGQAAWITNAVQLGFVVGAVGSSVSGLADAIAARRLMTGAALLAALANFSLLAAPDFSGLFAARFVTGLALAGLYPPALKVIAGWFVKGRGLAMGAAVGALTLGSSAAYLIRAFGGVDWRLVVTVSSAAALLAAGLTAACLREGPYAAARPKFRFDGVALVLRDRGLLLANLGYFGHMWELYALWAWFFAYAQAAERAPALAALPSAAILAFLVIGAGAAGCVCGGLLGDRIGRTATTALMMSISGVCALAIGFAFDGPAWLFGAVALVWGFTAVADSAQFSAAVSELADRETIGAALALQTGIGFALTLVSIRLVPLLAGAVGWRWAFLMLAPGPFIGVLAMLALRRSPESLRVGAGLR